MLIKKVEEISPCYYMNILKLLIYYQSKSRLIYNKIIFINCSDYYILLFTI